MICPNCKTNLEGDLIFDTFMKKYGDEAKSLKAAEMFGATKTTGRWGREIGFYDMELDETVSFMCPDCYHKWLRK